MRQKNLGRWRWKVPRRLKMVRELTGILLDELPELSWREARAGTIPCRAGETITCANSWGGVCGCSRELEPLWNVLLQAARKHGGGPMGYQALSAQRLIQGTPWFGYDFGEKQIPHEAALESSHISYTKGCYTGQEIVERVRSRGQVNRRRVELLFGGDGVPESGAELTVEGKPGDS